MMCEVCHTEEATKEIWSDGHFYPPEVWNVCSECFYHYHHNKECECLE